MRLRVKHTLLLVALKAHGSKLLTILALAFIMALMELLMDRLSIAETMLVWV
jgi:hypothetical protein